MPITKSKNASPSLANPKREKFAQALVEGASQIEAAKKAGYNLNSSHLPSLPSRLANSEEIQKRVMQLIEEKEHAHHASSTWFKALSLEVPELLKADPVASFNMELRLVDMKQKIIDQIARLGGWEQNKTITTKNMNLKGNVSDLLPKA
jgi:hypothetical protein